MRVSARLVPFFVLFPPFSAAATRSHNCLRLLAYLEAYLKQVSCGRGQDTRDHFVLLVFLLSTSEMQNERVECLSIIYLTSSFLKT